MLLHMETNTQQVGPKFPHITSEIIGHDGNAFNLLGIVQRDMRRAKVSYEDQKQFLEEAMSGDYDNLLITIMKWVNVR
jgi:hypothetical protein